jgi:catechol 2,3-dioxygenase-like lactoylglutathione lyase family enzyme
MAAFKIVNANHIGITVKDLDKALKLFLDALGYELVDRATRPDDYIENLTGVKDGGVKEIAYVRGPAHTLEIFQYKSPADRRDTPIRPCDASASHVCLEVDDIQGALDALGTVGLGPVNPPMTIAGGPNKGGKLCYVRDPNGVTLEIMQRPN